MKINATTFVICPIGSTIQLFTHKPPKMGQVFNITHIDTHKVVQIARVTEIIKPLPPNTLYDVRAVITK